MKLKSIVALLGLTACSGAFADPFVGNSAAPSTINVVANGEQSLQTIADSAFGAGHINVDTGQSSAGLFSATTPSFATSVPTLIAEFTANANTQSFGIWFGTDTTNIVSYNLLLGGAVATDAVRLTITGNTLNVFGPAAGCGTHYVCGSFTDAAGVCLGGDACTGVSSRVRIACAIAATPAAAAVSKPRITTSSPPRTPSAISATVLRACAPRPRARISIS